MLSRVFGSIDATWYNQVAIRLQFGRVYPSRILSSYVDVIFSTLNVDDSRIRSIFWSFYVLAKQSLFRRIILVYAIFCSAIPENSSWNLFWEWWINEIHQLLRESVVTLSSIINPPSIPPRHKIHGIAFKYDRKLPKVIPTKALSQALSRWEIAHHSGRREERGRQVRNKIVLKQWNGLNLRISTKKTDFPICLCLLRTWFKKTLKWIVHPPEVSAGQHSAAWCVERNRLTSSDSGRGLLILFTIMLLKGCQISCLSSV